MMTVNTTPEAREVKTKRTAKMRAAAETRIAHDKSMVDSGCMCRAS